MRTYYKDTDRKLVEIFKGHCNLSQEQYEEIRAQLIYMVADIQESEPVEERVQYLMDVFEFLLNTKELWIEEYDALCNLVREMENAEVLLRTAEEAKA